jgi:hypothetical protein
MTSAPDWPPSGYHYQVRLPSGRQYPFTTLRHAQEMAISEPGAVLVARPYWLGTWREVDPAASRGDG